MDGYRAGKRSIKVFVSSTYTDLVEHRRAVLDALVRIGSQAHAMEFFGAREHTPKHECVAEARACDLYIGIIAMRYGTCDPETGLSLTHLEYLEAQKRRIPCLIYLLDEERQPILAKHIETGDGSEKLARFKEQLRREFTVGYFTSPQDLARQVSQDVPPILPRFSSDTPTIDTHVSSELGEMLRQHRESRNEALDVILARGDEARCREGVQEKVAARCIDWYRRVEEGIEPVPLAAVPALAHAYDIDPSLLQALAAAPETTFLHLSRDSDYIDCSYDRPEMVGTVHRVPKAKLAGSATVILRVSLAAEAASILHRHPGEEVVAPLSGQIEVLFPECTGSQARVVLAVGQILHFRSEMMHQFVNRSARRTAECLVIRFLGRPDHAT